MTEDRPDPSLPAAPPDPDAWGSLPDDLFTRVVPHVRRALATLEGLDVTPEVRRLQAVPAHKLGRGRSRGRLLAVLAGGGPAWIAVRERIAADPDVVEDLVTALAEGDQHDAPHGDDQVGASRLAEAVAARDDQRDLRDRARAERDEARRRAAGAEGREASLRAEVVGLRGEVDQLRGRVEALRTDLAATDDATAAAVARAIRRTASERVGLADELAEARREVDELRRERARRDAAPNQADAATATPAPGSGQRSGPGSGPGAGLGARAGARSGRRSGSRPGPPSASALAASGRVVAGRPSRLPADLRVDTRDGAARLVDAVGDLLVDGYNVTRTHRDDLDLAAQRDWLVRGLEGLVARRRVSATVVFDAHLDGGGPQRRRPRGAVAVQWSHPGVTADDEIVFAVEARERDRPLVVVTDDRELRARLAPSRIDLLPTASLAWLLG